MFQFFALELYQCDLATLYVSTLSSSYVSPANGFFTDTVYMTFLYLMLACLLVVSSSLITSASTLDNHDLSDFSIYAPNTAYFKYLNQKSRSPRSSFKSGPIIAHRTIDCPLWIGQMDWLPFDWLPHMDWLPFVQGLALVVQSCVVLIIPWYKDDHPDSLLLQPLLLA